MLRVYRVISLSKKIYKIKSHKTWIQKTPTNRRQNRFKISQKTIAIHPPCKHRNPRSLSCLDLLRAVQGTPRSHQEELSTCSARPQVISVCSSLGGPEEPNAGGFGEVSKPPERCSVSSIDKNHPPLTPTLAKPPCLHPLEVPGKDSPTSHGKETIATQRHGHLGGAAPK